LAEEDFAQAGTAEDDYMGGGGFLKRGWNDTTEPLRKAKKTNAALPADMMNKAGVRATTAQSTTGGVNRGN
jgi:hypothetical protein